jgi:hypothetical protein
MNLGFPEPWVLGEGMNDRIEAEVIQRLRTAFDQCKRGLITRKELRFGTAPRGRSP